MLKLIAKIFVIPLLITGAALFYYYGYSSGKSTHLRSRPDTETISEETKLKGLAAKAKLYCKKKNYNTEVCILIDMSLPSGKNRLFEYDMEHGAILTAGLVAHGSCNYNFLTHPKFSNEPGCGCTALGKYKIGNKYKGRFGNAYKLYGLDSSNNNAFKRNIVLHSYYMVPDKETDPVPICNSLGCTMISESYMSNLTKRIDSSNKPLLLWIFE